MGSEDAGNDARKFAACFRERVKCNDDRHSGFIIKE